MQRVQLQAGYVLHHRVFRETSLILDVLTPDYGVVRLIARGARSPKSRRRPLLQVFRPLLVSWSGRGEMKTLTGVEEQGMPFVLQGLQLACGYYLNELLLRLLRYDESNITVFARYSMSLAELSSPLDKQATESCLREFEMELLESLGLMPDFADCVLADESGATTEPMPGSRYRYYAQTGRAKMINDEDVADTGLDTYVEVSGEALLSLAARDFSDSECRVDMKRLMRFQLAMHLGDEPLKSREMIGFYSQAGSSAKKAAAKKIPEATPGAGNEPASGIATNGNSDD